MKKVAGTLRVPSAFIAASSTEIHTLSVGLLLCLISFAANGLAREPDFTAMDSNENGTIEPAEIPARDLTVIARYATLTGLDIRDSMPITVLEKGRVKYVKSLDGGGKELELAGEREFGRVRGTRVRPFGIVGDFADRYTPEVRRGAISLFQKFDDNRDGLLTQKELSFAYRSNVQSWMRGDSDGNSILTFPEVANAVAAERERRRDGQIRQRSTWLVDGVEITPEHRSYAERLMNKFDGDQNRRLEDTETPKEWKTGNMWQWSDLNEDGQITATELQTGAARYLQDAQMAAERKSDPNLRHCESLAANMMRRYDLDKDRSLNRLEWMRLGGDIASADQNGNQLIVLSELTTWLLERLSVQPGGGLPEDLPDWFLDSDADFDGQVTLAEFIASQTPSRLANFSHYDRDTDSIVTAAECHLKVGPGKTRYESQSPRVLEAEHEVASAVYVPDEILIADVDVQVAILKDGDDDLDLRLVGPDGTTAALYFTNRRKAWGGGRMFDDTLIDDEAPQAATRLPSPPAHRSFRPQGMGDPRLSSLKAFYGKPAKGTWQLIVGNNARNRGRSAGLLKGWALLVKPATTKPENKQGLAEPGAPSATASETAPKNRDENRRNPK